MIDASDLATIEEIVSGKASSGHESKTARLQRVMDYLHTNRQDYHWVGVYRLEGQTLVLGPYQGPKTDHDRIPVGRGVCGTAVLENKNQVVGDVREVSNYLACNLETRSEIVVLIRDDAGQIVGQIDVDGTKVNQFNHGEEAFLAKVGEHVRELL